MQPHDGPSIYVTALCTSVIHRSSLLSLPSSSSRRAGARRLPSSSSSRPLSCLLLRACASRDSSVQSRCAVLGRVLVLAVSLGQQVRQGKNTCYHMEE